MGRLWPGKQIANAKFLHCRYNQGKSIFNMPECYRDRSHSQNNMEDSPYANNIAINRFLLESLLCLLYKIHPFLCWGSKNISTSEWASRIRCKTIQVSTTLLILGHWFQRDIGHIPTML